MVESSSRNPAGGRIVAAAERVFLRSGFSRVAMDDLAKELGMSKKTLYAHFESKEALLRAMLKSRAARMEAGLKELTEEDAPFPVKFPKVIHFVHEKASEVSPQFVEDVRRFAPDCFRIIDEARARMIPLYFGRLIGEGARAGVLRTDLDPALLTRVFLTMVQSLVRPDVAGDLKTHPSILLDQILSITFQGILTPQGRKACRKIFAP